MNLRPSPRRTPGSSAFETDEEILDSGFRGCVVTGRKLEITPKSGKNALDSRLRGNDESEVLCQGKYANLRK